VFLRKRLRRLLPPFWVFGAVMLAIMLTLGWQVDAESGGVDLSWSNVWLWVFPLADPPASSEGFLWVLPMWYIRAYLWFLLLSPALLWLFRRWPLRLLVLPAVVLPLLTLGLIDFPDPYWDIICITCMYAACWLLGFAHHDGKLRRLPLAPTLLAGTGLMALGLWHALGHQEQYGSWNVDDNPVAGMLYFTGAVLILLRIYVSFDWLQRLPTLDAVVSLLNNRAMTIYLWGNFAIAMTPLVLVRTPLARFDTDDARGQALQYGCAWTLVLVAVLLLGWVEDVAAARRPRLLPWHRVSHRRTAAAAAAPDTVRPDDATAPAMAGSPVSGATAVGSLAGPAATAPTKAPASPAAGAGGPAVPPEADGSEPGPTDEKPAEAVPPPGGTSRRTSESAQT
jgi:peptidoglycan/LPS O-acetylase OafA/YrhL